MEELITYAHKSDPDGQRFIQRKEDPLPKWAVNVRPLEEKDHTFKPVRGYFAKCQCGEMIGAIDMDRSDQEEVFRIVNRWIYKGCTLTPVFDHNWSTSITQCKCFRQGN